MALEGGRELLLVVGNLLEEPVDAIVNAANGHLAHGGGVAAAIERAAGRRLTEEGDAYVRAHGPVKTGEACVTTAGDLPHMGVIHAVGPRQGEGGEEEKLVRAVSSALVLASQSGWGSMALPAISSGIFAVPIETCARAYVRGVREFFRDRPEASVRSVRLVVFPGPIVEAVWALMA